MGDYRGCMRSCGRGWRRRLAGLATLVLAAFLALPVNAQQATNAASLVFDGVTVVDVESSKLVPDQRVVVAGNRIQAVGSRNAVAVPRGAQVVDARGKYLIPGLWDLHVHPGAGPIDSLRSRHWTSKAHIFYPLFIANGVTGIRDAWSATPLKTLVAWRREILAGTRVGPPRQLLAGAAFGQHYESRDSAVVERIVDSLKAEGANFLKVYQYTSTVAAAARRAGLQFGGHISGDDPIEPSDNGIAVVDHLNSSGVARRCIGGSATLDDCRAVAERFRRNGTWWVPTLAIMPGIQRPTDPTTSKRYRLTKGQYIVDSILRKLSTKFWWMDTVFSGNWLRDGASPVPGPGSTSESHGFLHIAQRAGLPLLAGTDVNVGAGGGMGSLLPGIALHAELAIYVAEGLTPLEALQTATLNPAKMLHGTDSLGTVAQGKLADLVLLDADPLADITNTTTIRAVVANGRYFNRAALDSLLREAQASGP